MAGEVDAILARLVRGDAPALYLLLDAEDRVVESNRHSRLLVGPRLPGSRFGDLLATFERSLSAAALAREGAVRNVNVITFTGLPQTYRCWFLPVGDQTVVFGAVDPEEQELLRRELLTLNQDLSARQRTLVQSQSDLARMGRLKDQFLGMAAHDLRSPITAIAFFSEFLETDLAGRLDAEDASYLQGIRRSVELMRSLVEAFLDTALIESGHLRLELQPTRLEQVLEEAQQVLSPVARRRGIPVRVDCQPGLPELRLDGPKLQQVLINLVNNAMQHSRPGAEVLVAARQDGPEVLLEVRDRGSGIAPSVQKELFSAYVHGNRKGTAADRSVGLGLAITRMIVVAHGGRVTASSELGVGSTFTVHLPVPAA